MAQRHQTPSDSSRNHYILLYVYETCLKFGFNTFSVLMSSSSSSIRALEMLSFQIQVNKRIHWINCTVTVFKACWHCDLLKCHLLQSSWSQAAYSQPPFHERWINLTIRKLASLYVINRESLPVHSRKGN